MWINGGDKGVDLDVWKLFSPTNGLHRLIQLIQLSGSCSVLASPLLNSIHTGSSFLLHSDTPTYWNKCSYMLYKLLVMFINTAIYITQATLLSQCFLQQLHTHTFTQAHISERVVGVPRVEDIALIRDWSLRGVSPFNDHHINQSSFFISLYFFPFLCSPVFHHVQPHTRLNTLFLFSAPPTIPPIPLFSSIISRSLKIKTYFRRCN